MNRSARLVSLIALTLLAAAPATVASAKTPVLSGPAVDKSFGSAGLIPITRLGSGVVFGVESIHPAPDGSVYVVSEGDKGHIPGRPDWEINVNWRMIHFFKSGKRDYGFGNGGSLMHLPRLDDYPPTIAIDAKGRLLLTRHHPSTVRTHFTRLRTFRFSPRGKLDKTFASSGHFDFDTARDRADAVVSPDAVGGVWIGLNEGAMANSLVHLDPKGRVTSRPIPTFGEGRCPTRDIFEIVPMSDGSAIVYCANLPRAFSDEVWNGLLLRVRPDGAVFETWATNGKLPITAAPPGATQLPKSYSHSVSAFREAPGGALSIAIIDGAHHREVEWTARLTPSGIFDNVYGDGGSAPTDRPDCLACALFPQSDGSWIASQVGKNGDVNVFRISSSGQSPPRRVSASFNGRTYGLWPIPTPDGKYLYGFLNREADRKGAPDRSFIYRLRLTD